MLAGDRAIRPLGNPLVDQPNVFEAALFHDLLLDAAPARSGVLSLTWYFADRFSGFQAVCGRSSASSVLRTRHIQPEAEGDVPCSCQRSRCCV